MNTKPKLCPKCGNPGSFYVDRKSNDGIQSWCKKCKLAAVKRYYTTQRGLESRRRYDRKRTLRRYYANRIASNMARSIRRSLNNNKGGTAWYRILGYNLSQLRMHLESLFMPGMTWENYGIWHIDHIKPIAMFNITSVDCEEFRQCWALSNLRPMWATDNIKKGSKYSGGDR